MPPKDNLYLGLNTPDREKGAYAEFFNPVMAPLPEHLYQALSLGAIAHPLLPPVEQAHQLQASGYLPVETGYTLCPDGAAHIAVLTPMPGVKPSHWDWWFAWHGSDPQRYKLWHPQAHLHVAWQDGRDDLGYYIDRVSNVVEFVGPVAFSAAIRFVRPARMGLDEVLLKAMGETAICARIGLTIAGIAIESGWLLHHVRPVAGGSEMRSRFWLGGRNVRLFGWEGSAGRWLGRLASRLRPITREQIRELMVHDAQEMSHLSSFLPQLHARFATALPSHEEVAA